MANSVRPDLDVPTPSTEYPNALMAFQKQLVGTCLFVEGDKPKDTADRYAFAQTIQPILVNIARVGRGEPVENLQLERDIKGLATNQGTKLKILEAVLSEREHRASRLPKGVQEIELELSINYDLRIEDGRCGLVPSCSTRLISDFLTALTHSDTDTVRIRECPVCRRIFWARHTKARVCSNRCRVKKWQLDNPQEWARIQKKHERRRKRSARKLRQNSSVVPNSMSCNRCGRGFATHSELVSHKQEHSRQDALSNKSSKSLQELQIKNRLKGVKQ
jgi:hypothetical protein